MGKSLRKKPAGQGMNLIPPTPGIPGASIKPEDRPIDKFFWFNLSRKWVGDGLKNVIDACERLKTAVAWFFGIGTSGFFLSAFFGSDTFKQLDLGFMFIPILLFLLSYGLAVFGQTVAISREFDPNKHATIQSAYNAAMSKSKLYLISSAAALMSALVGFPLVINNAMNEKRSVEKELVFQATYVLKDTVMSNVNRQYITKAVISGKLPGVKQARVIVEKAKNPSARSVIEETPMIPDGESGTFSMVIPVSGFHIVAADEKVYLSIEFPTADVGEFHRETKLITLAK